MKKTNRYDDEILGMLPNHKPYTVKTDPWVTGLNTNQVVIGGAGSGKTTSVVEPNLLRMKNGNAVVVLTKSGRSETIKYALRQNGYRIFDIAFDHPEKANSYGYDPLAYCHNDTDIRSLAHEIAYAGDKEPGFNEDPYWRDSSESILYAVLWYVAHGYYSRGKRLQDALYLLDRYSWGEPDNCGTLVLDLGFEDDGTDRAQELKADYLRCKHRTPEEKERIKEYEDWLKKANARRDERSRSFAERCRLQDEIRLQGKNIDTDIFDAEIVEESEEQEDYALPYPVQVICDDFATGCPIPDFDAKISILREKRIGITMLLQSESQLAALYGDRKARTIINNCDTYLYFGGMDMNTVQSIAQRMNIPYDEVQAMPLGEEYIIRRGQKPIIARRFSLFEDPLYQKILAEQKKKASHPGSSPSDKEVLPCLF